MRTLFVVLLTLFALGCPDTAPQKHRPSMRVADITAKHEAEFATKVVCSPEPPVGQQVAFTWEDGQQYVAWVVGATVEAGGVSRTPLLYTNPYWAVADHYQCDCADPAERAPYTYCYDFTRWPLGVTLGDLDSRVTALENAL